MLEIQQEKHVDMNNLIITKEYQSPGTQYTHVYMNLEKN